MEGFLVRKAKVAPFFGAEGAVNGCEEGFVIYICMMTLSLDQLQIPQTVLVHLNNQFWDTGALTFNISRSYR